eukprot:TRINITY_DN5715_c0_g1_i1.p2 TRINITY_DN5715_c0_g1~~TRINITY_DN5715_c0_g1_i1.p2  ORF type:complete len:155 (-),score=22.19 TRINITY_DN5715_c0_g1_i1:255-719(-)
MLTALHCRVQACSTAEVSMAQMYMYAIMAYAVWQLLYYVLVGVYLRQKIEDGDRITTINFLLSDPTNLIYKFCKRFKRARRIYVVMSLQFLLSLVSMLPAKLMWEYFWLQQAYCFSWPCGPFGTGQTSTSISSATATWRNCKDAPDTVLHMQNP